MIAQKSTLPELDAMQEKWYIVDAEGQYVGRLASRIAKLVRGKMSVLHAPHINPKIHIVVTNADKVLFTGDKAKTKIYYHHTPYKGHLKATTPEKLLPSKKGEEVLRMAIHGMLPKTRLGRVLQRNLRIYKAGEYNDQHKAQQPEPLKIVSRIAKSN